MSTHYVCPQCGSSELLWQSVEAEIDVTAWRPLDDQLNPGDVDAADIVVDTSMAVWQPDGLVGCGMCNWEARGRPGDVLRMVTLDINGEEMPPLNPNQMELPL